MGKVIEFPNNRKPKKKNVNKNNPFIQITAEDISEIPYPIRLIGITFIFVIIMTLGGKDLKGIPSALFIGFWLIIYSFAIKKISIDNYIQKRI